MVSSVLVQCSRHLATISLVSRFWFGRTCDQRRPPAGEALDDVLADFAEVTEED